MDIDVSYATNHLADYRILVGTNQREVRYTNFSNCQTRNGLNLLYKTEIFVPQPMQSSLLISLPISMYGNN